MTRLLERAIAEVTHLPDTEQNIVAKWLLSELASERKWEQAFAESEDVLSILADEALSANRQKKAKVLDMNRL